MDNQVIGFEGRRAAFQYHLLMGLYRLAVNRWLFGVFCRFLARWFQAGNAVLVNLGHGARFRVHLNDGYWTRFLLFRSDYEPEVQRVLDAAKGETPLFCDLGANKGLWSAYGAVLFDRVIAVEASAETFSVLKQNTADLPNVTLFRRAVFSKSNQELTFVNVHNSHASAHLSLSGKSDVEDRSETVQTIAIDTLVPAGTPALLKLDVEGAEVDAFQGAKRALAEGSVLIYEDHGSDDESLPSAYLLQQDGIQVFALEGGMQLVTDVAQSSALKTDRYKGYNFLAGRSDSALLAAIAQRFAND